VVVHIRNPSTLVALGLNQLSLSNLIPASSPTLTC
jgi:hypothetical protein